jgi:Tfp pilus assembly protein PilN
MSSKTWLLLLLPSLLGIALLVIHAAVLVLRQVRQPKRRPRARDLVPAHLQVLRQHNAKIKRLRRQARNLFWQLRMKHGLENARHRLWLIQIITQDRWQSYNKPRWGVPA